VLIYIAGIAWGYFLDSIEDLGYGTLHITTNGKFADRLQTFCAGYLEGALTASRIFDLWRNFYDSTFRTSKADPRLEERLFGFAQETMQWTRDQIDVTGPGGGDHHFYWNQVDMVMIQLDGMVGGYNAFRPTGARPLSDRDLFLLNMLGDTDDLIPALTRQLMIEDFGRANVLLYCWAISRPNFETLGPRHVDQRGRCFSCSNQFSLLCNYKTCRRAKWIYRFIHFP